MALARSTASWPSFVRSCVFCNRTIGEHEPFMRINDGAAHATCACHEARQRADLLSLAMETTTMRRNGRRHVGRCPFHNDRSPSFFVYEADGVQRFTCYGAGCGVSGDVVDFVMRRNNLDTTEAVRSLLGTSHFTPLVRREPLPPPPPPKPLPESAALRYHLALTDEARQWWHAQGCSDEVIAHFQLGYCSRCRTYVDDDHPDYTSASYTIPIFAPDGSLLNIRHRIAAPLDPKDKYRPETANRGAHLFNLGAVGDSSDVIIAEGEKKVMVWWRHFHYWPAITATSGCRSWLRQYRDIWPPLLAHVRRIYVMFDPGAEDDAERTAGLFGRRGIPVYLPEKLDDLLIHAGTDPVIDAMSGASPWRETSYFDVPALTWA